MKSLNFSACILLLKVFSNFFEVCFSDKVDSENVRIENLIAEPSFDSVLVTWQKISIKELISSPVDQNERFLVQTCENQAWGLHQCNSQTISTILGTRDSSRNQPGVIIKQNSPQDANPYSLTLKGLRMSTMYTITVSIGDTSNGRNVSFETKGFSASSIVCEPSKTRVEIETGPNFGGQISVDSPNSQGPGGSKVGDKDFCFINGNESSPQTSYTFDIVHDKCDGVQISGSQMTASITVQESLVIMTHSTRRFSITCDFGPTTFTVAAGLNVPLKPKQGTGIGSVTAELLDYEEVSREFKDIDAARSRRKINFGNDTSNSQGSSHFSTIVVKKRKKNSTDPLTTEQAFLVTANGLVSMPQVQIQIREDQKENASENTFLPRFGFWSGELESDEQQKDLTTTDLDSQRPLNEMAAKQTKDVLWEEDFQDRFNIWENNLNEGGRSKSSGKSIWYETETRQSKDFKMSPVDEKLMNQEQQNKNTSVLRSEQEKRTNSPIRLRRRNHTEINPQKQQSETTNKDSAMASSLDGSKQSDLPAVPHLVLMVVVVISAIIATGAATYWLVTTCQRKIATRNRGFLNNSCILAPMPDFSEGVSDDCPVYENVETSSITIREDQPKCLSRKTDEDSFL